MFLTPYMESHIDFDLYADWLREATILSIVFLVILTVVLIAVPNFRSRRYLLLLVAVPTEFAIVWFFFVAHNSI